MDGHTRYDDRDIRDYSALVSKKAALEAQKSASELETSETFASLEGEISDLRAQLDASRPDLLDEDFERVFRGTLRTPNAVNRLMIITQARASGAAVSTSRRDEFV